MKPENHAIRQLEKQLDGATPEVASAITHVILSLTNVIENKNPAAKAKAREILDRDTKELERVLKSNSER